MPMVPACMLTRSDCTKTASPMVTSNDPVRAPPLRTRSQVSRSAPAPSGVRQIDLFEHQCGTGNEKSPFVGEFARELWAKVGDGMKG